MHGMLKLNFELTLDFRAIANAPPTKSKPIEAHIWHHAQLGVTLLAASNGQLGGNGRQTTKVGVASLDAKYHTALCGSIMLRYSRHPGSIVDAE